MLRLAQACARSSRLGIGLATSLVCGCLAGADTETAERGGWHVEAALVGDHVSVTATITRFHGDFVHMSLRKVGWNSRYDVARSPAPTQPEHDWSRVHQWFGEMHRTTYLEGRIDDGGGEGPTDWTMLRFDVPTAAAAERYDAPDALGSGSTWITSPYGYADGHVHHPFLGPGAYEIEIYAWYSGVVDARHRAADGRREVQYVHQEAPLASTRFVIE